MKNKAVNAKTYVFKPAEQIFLDTNIWLYLKPPASQPTPMWTSEYSFVFARLLKAKAELVTDVTVLSEYLNAYTRIEYRAHGGDFRYRSFKHFRQSAEGKIVLKSVVTELHQILTIATLVNVKLANMAVASLLDDVESGSVDFNDRLIAANCQANEWKLISNDADLISGGISILTLNKRLLQDCA